MDNFHVIVKKITKFDGSRVDELLEWDSNLCTSLSVYIKIIFSSYKGRSGHPNSMPTRRPLSRPGMPQIETYTACSSSLQLVQRSSWFGGFRAKHRLREQDTDSRRGQPFARNSTGARGWPLGRSKLR